MKFRLLYATIMIAILIAVACAPKATPPPVDVAGTLAVQLASSMLTQTVAAYSPTPPATETPVPVTATIEPTKDTSGNIITVVTFTGCYRGPGKNYPLQSYINVPKKVELLGTGSVPGWYIIKGPYFYTACWVAAANVQIPANVDPARFPVMTPSH
jgi:hypothetical protein